MVALLGAVLATPSALALTAGCTTGHGTDNPRAAIVWNYGNSALQDACDLINKQRPDYSSVDISSVGIVEPIHTCIGMVPYRLGNSLEVYGVAVTIGLDARQASLAVRTQASNGVLPGASFNSRPSAVPGVEPIVQCETQGGSPQSLTYPPQTTFELTRAVYGVKTYSTSDLAGLRSRCLSLTNSDSLVSPSVCRSIVDSDNDNEVDTPIPLNDHFQVALAVKLLDSDTVRPIGNIDCDNDGIRGTAPNAARTACLCPAGRSVFAANNGIICAPPLPPEEDGYSIVRCMGAGWSAEWVRDSDGRIMSCCLVPSRLASSLTSESIESFASVGAQEVPAQISAGDNVDACVMTQNAGFDAANAGVADVPMCNNPLLFGSGGFPQKPSGFNDADTGNNRHRLEIESNQTANSQIITWQGDAVPRYAGAAPSASSGSSGGGGGNHGAALGLGIAAFVGILAYNIWDGDASAFAFSPDVGINYDSQSGHVLRYGSRMDFRQDEWHAWWSAAQTNTRNGTGGLRYGSGAEYAGQGWKARLQSDGYGKSTDSAFSLSAKKEFGLWSFAPLYRVQYDRSETAESWEHSLSLKAVWQINQWTLTNSAGFYGESLAAFGDNTSIKVLLRHDF